MDLRPFRRVDLRPFRRVAANTVAWLTCVEQALGDPELMAVWASASNLDRERIAAVLGVPTVRKLRSLCICETHESVVIWLERHTPVATYGPRVHNTLRSLTNEIMVEMTGKHVADADLKDIDICSGPA